MDFGFTQEQKDLEALAGRILTELAPPESLPRFEDAHDPFDGRLWGELAKAGLLGIALPEDVGGMGMGIVELGLLLEQVGRTLAPAPCLETLVMGAAPIARFGDAEQQRRLLPDVAAGKLLLTAALLDEGARDPHEPATEATPEGSGWRLSGVKAFVPMAASAGRILVPARTPGGAPGLFLLDPGSPGVELESETATTGERQYRLAMNAVEVRGEDILGRPQNGSEILAWTIERTLAGLCAMELGVASRAVQMTAEYTSQRKQFGKEIATFQAVAQRAADAWIDVDALRLATRQALWRLSQELPAAREVAIAKFWAAEGGHRACYAAQHLHGGIGVDTDYPLHRYYLASRRIELTLGGAHAQLARLGSALAAA